MNRFVEFKWAAAGAPAGEVRVGLVQDGRLLGGAEWPEDLRRAAEGWIGEEKYEGKAGTAAWPRGCGKVLLAGIGPKKDFHAARWVRAWAAAGRALAKAAGVGAASFEWPVGTTFPMGIEELAGLAADGLAGGAYVFDGYRTEKKARGYKFWWRGEALGAKGAREAVRRSAATSEVLWEVKDLANRAANEFGPEELAAAAKRLAKAAGAECRVWNAKALEREKCGALLAVAKGSRRPACLIRVATAGKGGGRLKPLVVVGKAVTFDSGGLTLKPGKGMEWMKYDKSGGMAALAAVLVAARLGTRRPVVVYVPAVENMPGGGATRPGDVVRARNGKTVEILNTDAEGRLILADALTFAAEEGPAAIVDVATLTGAAVVALGHEVTALMANDDRLALDLVLSGEATGERLWQLPLWPEYEEMVKGQFADLKNVGDGSAGTIAGGAFLKQFVPDDVPWAHLDIAGTAWLEKDEARGEAGATLAPARLLADWAARAHGEP